MIDIQDAKEQYREARDYWIEQKKLAVEDAEFYEGRGQWPTQVKRTREADPNNPRPCLIINKTKPIIKQVTNEQRKNKPAIRVKPFDSGADKDVADIYEGLIRHIRNNSKARQAYNTAFDHAVISGIGFWRIVRDYISPDSMHEDLFIKRIRNPRNVYFDPACEELDYSDARFCFVLEQMPKEEFKELYPDAETTGFGQATLKENNLNETVQIAEYWYVEETPMMLYQLRNGQKVYEDDYKEMAETMGEAFQDAAFDIIQERDSVKRKVKWAKLTDSEVLEEGDWEGKWIPIVPCIGEEIDLDGEIVLTGMVRDLMDAQRMHNYWKSMETELVALAPKAPFMATPEQIQGHEMHYQEANIKNIPVLPYNAVPGPGGTPLPPPMRQPYAGQPAGAMTQSMGSSDDMKAISGIHDASLGAQSNEISGRAIMARVQEGDTSNFNYTDNLTIALEHTGKILVDLIPKVFSQQMVIRILGEDGQETIQEINRQTPDKNGKIFDLTQGTYDVVIETGPSYASKREAMADTMLQMTGKMPMMMEPATDLMVQAMDFPNASEVSERIGGAIDMKYPGLRKAGEQDQIPPQVAGQMMQMQQQMQQMQQALQAAQAEIQSKEKDRAVELQKAQLQAQTQVQVAKMNTQSREDVALLQSETDIEEKRMQEQNEVRKIQAAQQKNVPDL